MSADSRHWSPQERAFAKTVLYASLFEYPLTLREVRQALLEEACGETELLRTYHGSARLQAVIETRDGLFFPRGRDTWIQQRYAREAWSLAFLYRHAWLLRIVALIPFVRLVALSGSVAALNADRDADLDLFVVTKGRRVWMVTLAIVLLAKLTRRRPVVCLNFVMSDDDLRLEQQDLFSANQVIQLQPVAGHQAYLDFLAANPFVRGFYPNFDSAAVYSPLHVEPGAGTKRIQRALEWLLAGASGIGEALSRALYGWHLRRRASSWRSPDQVRLQPACLKLHTSSHRHRTLDRFEQLCRETLPPETTWDTGAKPLGQKGDSHHPMKLPLSRIAHVIGALALTFVIAPHAHAQIVISPVETLDFDRPESWALKYFTSNTLLSGLEMPEARPAGSVQIGLEISWIPKLSTDQQRIGFNGTKEEDLNKAPFFARPRLSFWLPGQFSVTVAGVPPVETFGITPRLFALAVGRPIVTSEAWNLGARVSTQFGTATSSFTCPEDVLAFPPLDPRNSYGCRALSSDVATLRYVGGEVDIWRSPGASRISPHFTVGVNYMDSVFQVDAMTAGAVFEFHDRTRLLTSGVTVAFSGGLTYALTDRLSAGVDVFYSPLSVRRPPETSSDIEGLLNARGLLMYRVR